MENRVKMWILGTTFIVTSGLIYFLFLAAWLNFFLFVGYIFWVRAMIGFLALGVGAYYLHDYRKNREGACKVTGGEKKKKVFERIKEVVQTKNFAFAMVGIMILAIAVNMVELVCSAGLPAVYTQVLSLSGFPVWQYYLYLIFYILIFMLDDLVVFGIAMITLRSIGLSGKYARLSHLIGGIIMLIIGILLLFKPEWLMFG
jgi:hypothetical protein